jgi:hypothetical protein
MRNIEDAHVRSIALLTRGKKASIGFGGQDALECPDDVEIIVRIDREGRTERQELVDRRLDGGAEMLSRIKAERREDQTF